MSQVSPQRGRRPNVRAEFQRLVAMAAKCSWVTGIDTGAVSDSLPPRSGAAPSMAEWLSAATAETLALPVCSSFALLLLQSYAF